jgi:hypothetical protein
VLWLGSEFRLTDDLRDALSGLPLVAVFIDTTSTAFEQELVSRDRLDRRLPVPISGREAVGTWEPQRHLPLFRVAGNRALTRSVMLGEISRLVEEKPLYVALAVDGPAATEFVDAVDESDPGAPLFLIGDEEELRSAGKLFSSRTSLTVEPYDGWDSFIDALRQLGVSLAYEEEPHVLVRDRRVCLNEIFADPELRIDDRVRIITTRALFDYEQADNLESLFDSFMRLDEARSAPTVQDDVDEWWAIGQGFAYRRPQLGAVLDTVMSRLERLEAKGAPPRAPVCWLPCEAASGATTFLHLVAREVAAKGYPTLVVKQLARHVDAYQASTVLKELNRLAGENLPPEDQRERPALLVLDAQHAGVEALEELPDRLTGKRRQVLTLWAQRTAPGRAHQPQGEDPVAWYRESFSEVVHRRPLPQDEFLPPLTSGIDDAEVSLLEQHVHSLKVDKGLNLSERTRETWQAFQRSNEFRRIWRLPGMERDEEPALEEWLRTEELFWPALHHFLRRGGRQDGPVLPPSITGLPSYQDEDGDSLHAVARRGLAVEVAKASAWGIIVPTSALVDWGRAIAEDWSEGEDAEEPGGEGFSDDLSEVEERLRAWAEGRSHAPQPTWDPAVEMRRARDALEDLGALRSILLGGHAWVRTTHCVIARLLLLQAVNDRQDGSLPDTVAQHLGDASALWQRDKAFSSFHHLLSTLSFSPQNLALCEQLSEALLLGSPRDPAWSAGEGEARLQLYKDIPNALVESSRALLHHRALVRMRTTHFPDLSNDEKAERLDRAQRDIERALTLPWQTGVRDEHPGHLHTSMGLILRSMGRLGGPGARDRLSEARDHLERALAELPESRHTRLALAGLSLEEATRLSGSEDVDDQARAVGLAADVLRLLSVEPTGEEDRWAKTKHEAISLFDDQAGRLLIESLKDDGDEAGYLFDAELQLEKEGTRPAIGVLQPLVQGDGVARYLQATRRLAELLVMDDAGEAELRERFRLLSALDAAGMALTADEEFQLASLTYCLGRYDDGRRRFAVLRDTRKAWSVSKELWSYLLDPDTRTVAQFLGRVRSVDAGTGWMEVCEEATGETLFTARFVKRHFTENDIQARKPLQVVVRFTGPGPNAVPPRFPRSEGYRLG